MPNNGANEEIMRRFASDTVITEAVRRAVRAAILSHKRAGNPVATWQDGAVVLIGPEDIPIPEEEETSQQTYAPAAHVA
jgi:predicted metal-dependent phosphotriesterase family hydrolase